MHDRRIDGETYLFGNYGGVYQNAFTLYDHQTDSVWTQPWGRALIGELKGTTLRQIPSSLMTYGAWLDEYPDTLVLSVPNPEVYGSQPALDDYVIGVSFGENISRGYRYQDAAEEVVINDEINGVPILVHVNPDTRAVRVYIRQLSDGTELNFIGTATQLQDIETGSIWQAQRGIAISGDLVGQGIREIPFTSSTESAWLDFHPQTTFYDVE